MKKKIQAAFFSAVIIAGVITAVAIVHKFPLILVGLVVLILFGVIYDIVYRNLED